MSSSPNTLSAYQYRLLAVLALINFVNFAARQVFVPLIPLLRGPWSDGPSAGLAADRAAGVWRLPASVWVLCRPVQQKVDHRPGIMFWSVATFAGGLAIGLVFLAVTRAFVGLGEAAYAPAAQSMISGSFPSERRAAAQAIFASGMLLGGACGQVLAGSSPRATVGSKRCLWWLSPACCRP
jgi:MFS family permease